jgi:hypothetical protein
VITVTKATPSGTVVTVDGKQVTVKQDIPFCHKVAVAAIESGKPIIKYGVEIGEASTRIERGEHIHVHNVAEVSLQIRDRVRQQSLGGR